MCAEQRPVGIAPLSRTSSAVAVRDELAAMIRDGRFPVGSRLPGEIHLAEAFGVSRPVVREALGGLRAAGMIESRSGAGTFVIGRDRSDIGLSLLGTTNSAELHEVRMHLEVPGAALAASRRSDEQLARLREIADGSGEDDDVVEWVRADLRFHVLIAEMTGNSLHARLVGELRELQFEQSVQMARRLGGLGAPIREHGAIVEAIGDGDPERASRAMSEHLGAILDRAQIARSYQEFSR
ncbi:FadR/GntR family transcriptional regulator [Pseudonocardia acaciae]|uniref:FadR/GntR family transcriptional regulator n=1 Tax=Pseudonocardia acaciae TaxID=551276 RepID=UPI0007E8D9A4|nr:FadR/GntR family transcriptional regulator [Pseudonocardia acaciae]